MNKSIFASLHAEQEHTLIFTISEDMVKCFSQLIGDASSLHTDAAFARRSMYRANVVHGIFPVMFLSALEALAIPGYQCRLQNLSARFVKPIFIDETLMLSARVVAMDDEARTVNLEYTVGKPATKTIVLNGNVTVIYENASKMALSDDKNVRPIDDGTQSIVEALDENHLEFDEISKGDAKQFTFCVTPHHVGVLCAIIREGTALAGESKAAEYCMLNATDLFAAGLCSTFVGMCIPGKRATFMDFNVTYAMSCALNKTYLFSGRVAFKSQTTFVLAEEIMISDVHNQKEQLVTGKIRVKVNKPERAMPSVATLREHETDMQLRDKVVLITGASRGIGETTAKLFSLYGAKVVVNYFRGKEDAERIVQEIIDEGGQAVSVQADVTDRSHVQRMVAQVCETYGAVDVLVNSAVGDAYPIAFAELTWQDVQAHIDVVLQGAFNCCQEVLPLMVQAKRGKIVNITTAFTDAPPPDQSRYVMAKNALVGLTRSLAIEYAPHNIQVNMVAPSIVQTDLSQHVADMFFEQMRRETPMQRIATPVDVAKAVVMLSSSLASFTTGQKVMVTGGNLPLL